MPPINSFYITVSGLPSHEEQQIDFPSGVFGIPLRAHLSALNATFGFNQNPHRFELEYIPELFTDETLPQIGSGVQFFIGENFLVQGRIIHADFQKSARGSVVSVMVEDIRRDLANFVVDTYGIFGAADAPTDNIIDIRYWYIKNFAETRAFGRSKVIKDLNLLDRHGASYRQIYEAIKYFEVQVGTINDVISKIPAPEIIESQLPLDPDAYRWQFRSQPLIDVLVRILGDVSFDFYWNMDKRKIDVINRKFAINIDRTQIPVPNDPAAITSLRYGKDEAERSTTVRIYGAPMEGLIGIGKLKTESGAYDLAPSGAVGHDLYDLGITVGGGTGGAGTLRPTFIPGWRDARVKYFGPEGSIRIDIPNDRELKAALKGIEYWTMEKNLENRIDNSTIQQDAGNTPAQANRASASGLGFIQNRGQPGRQWVLEWFNRVRSFAQNHFGRTYILSPDTSLFNELDEFEVVNAAWCNIENLTDDGAFEDNYKIKAKFRWLAPFWDHDANKMRGWASFPIFVTPSKGVVSPKWGADGKGVPAQFTAWNEEENTQYVPIEVKKWNRAEDKFQEEFLHHLFNDEKGLMIRLPNICWQRYDTDIPDPQLNSKPILRFFNGSFHSETQADIISDPISIGDVFETLTDVAIPIKVKRRYGFKWPSPWASGMGTDFEVQIRDDFAPWEFEPRGQKRSWELMEDEALSAVASRVVARNQVTFAEVQKLGLPIISFDNFANQSSTPDGYGIVSHGVTALNITKNLGWWQTKYNIKSHFPQFIRAKPVPDKTEEDFEFILRRLEQRILPPPLTPFSPTPIFDPKTDDGKQVFTEDIKDSFTIPVTITQVLGDENNPNYVGVDDRGTTWPAAFRYTGLSTESLLFQERKAFATDGFLQIGMRAIYHYQDQEDGSFIHYFTGGIQLSASRVVELLESPRLVQGIFRSNVRTISETVLDIEGNPFEITPFIIRNVPYLNQQAIDTTLAAGDKIFMGSNGNENNIVKPNFDVSQGDSNGVGRDSVQLINSGVPANVGFALVLTTPNTTTGLGGKIQTISTSGGETIADGQIIGSTRFNIRFIGVEYDQVAVGDPCITVREREQGAEGQTRIYCFIVKPVFAPFSAAGPGPFLT